MALHLNEQDLANHYAFFKAEEFIPVTFIKQKPAEIAKLPFTKKTFGRMLDVFEPVNSDLIITTCTATRPYYKSPRLKRLNQLYGGYCDIIVTSVMGLCPLNLASAFPFTHYDGVGDDSVEFDYVVSKAKMIVDFLATFEYNHIFVVIKPLHDNGEYLGLKKGLEVALQLGFIKSFNFMPSVEQYAEAASKAAKGFESRQVLIYPSLLQVYEETIGAVLC